MATIYDIAKMCGYSVATVSYVLSGRGGEHRISEATQARIRQAAQSVHYQPNLSARRLRSLGGQNFTVALYWPSENFELALISVLDGVRQVLAGAQDTVDFVIRPYSRDHLREDKPLFSPNTPYHAAVIASLGGGDAVWLETHRPHIPVVLINRRVDGYSQVLVDNREAGALAAWHALEQSRDIGVVLGSASFASADERCRSFAETCRDRGVFLERSTVYTENNIEGGYAVGRRLLREGGLHRVTFCTSDAIAIGLLGALGEAGVPVGGDVQVLAVTNSMTAITAHTVPALTVVDLNFHEVVSRSLRLALEILSGQAQPPRKLMLHARLVARASCPAKPELDNSKGSK